MWSRFREKKIKEYEKAKIDDEIKPILDDINSVSCFVTLSSCSGRIVVMDMPSFGNKVESVFLGKWHSIPSFDEVLSAINKGKQTTWLMMHPPIIHIACENVESAKKLLEVAKNSGLRRSGIISMKNWVVEISPPERLEMVASISGKTLNLETLRINYQFCIEKLKKSRERIKKFRDSFRNTFTNTFTEVFL